VSIGSTVLLLAGLLLLTLSSPGGQVAGSRVVFRAPAGTPADVLDRSAAAVRERLRSLRIALASFSVDDASGVVVVDVPEADSATAEALGRTGWLEEREVVATLPPEDVGYANGSVTTIDPGTGRFAVADPGAPVVSYEDTNHDGAFTDGVDVKYRLGKVEITSSEIASASAQFVSGNFGNSGWRVAFSLTNEGSRRFADVTTRLIGKQLAILVDGVVQSAPTVQSPITGGQAEVTGRFEGAEAKQLAAVLDAPPLPIALEASSPAAVTLRRDRRWPVSGIVMVGIGALGLVVSLMRRPHARSRRLL
jgi:preprotein translocase subunit SecD